jgi:hypothetical protein
VAAICARAAREDPHVKRYPAADRDNRARRRPGGPLGLTSAATPAEVTELQVFRDLFVIENAEPLDAELKGFEERFPRWRVRA